MSMLKWKINLTGIVSALIIAQWVFIFTYLNENIINMDQGGVALDYLIAYAGSSFLILILLCVQKKLFVKPHLFIYLFFVTWVVVRAVFDYGDIESIKSFTIGTTGGILLFYIVGALFQNSFFLIFNKINYSFVYIFGIVLSLLLYFNLFSDLFGRIRGDIFLIEGSDLDYQRPGNFISISFVMTSVMVIGLSLNNHGFKGRDVHFIFWFLVYAVISLLTLICAQLIGSNSAFAVVAGVCTLTCITFIQMRRMREIHYFDSEKVFKKFINNISNGYFRFGLVGLAFLVFVASVFLSYTDFDIYSSRLLGFGSGSSESLSSRLEIFYSTGMDQLTYAPLLGSLNVSYLTTGDAGKTLHSFFPYVLVNLGAFGLIVVTLLFYVIFHQTYRSMRKEFIINRAPLSAIFSLYSYILLVFLLLFANLTVGVNWPVIWFAVGFLSRPFVFESNSTSGMVRLLI